LSTLAPELWAEGNEGPRGESRIYHIGETGTGILTKINLDEEQCEILWNTDSSLTDILHAIQGEEWHNEPVQIEQFNIARIGHQHTDTVELPSTICTPEEGNSITTLSELRKVMLRSNQDVRALLGLDPVEFSEGVVGTSIYWASEPVPDIQDDYPNRIRIRTPFPLSDQASTLFEWYYSKFAPSAIREEYERGGEPTGEIINAIRSYSP